MKSLSQIRRKTAWLNLPTATLLALLQRTPVVRVVVTAGEYVASSPVGSLLKSAAAAAASLGAYDTLAGATNYQLQTSTNSPATFTVGSQITPVVFTVTNTINVGSWLITGPVPPGLNITASEGGITPLTGTLNSSNGVLDATTQGNGDPYYPTSGNSSTTPEIEGTATTVGQYTLTMIAYEYGGATGGAETGLQSPMYTYVINVVASAGTSPTITTQPQSQTVNAGSSVTFTVAATGTPSPTYQWYLGSTPVSGATNSSYTISNVQTSNAGSYSALVTNSAGSVTSSTATLTVNATTTAPSITTQPQSQTVSAGASVTFGVTATGSPAPTYQWYDNNGTTNIAISGATSSTYSINNAQTTNSGTYTVAVSNSAGSITSSGAVLVVNASAPVFEVQPISQTIATGASVAFRVFATGSPTYQWYQGTTKLTGMTDATLLLQGTTAASAGSYACVATDSAGSTTSSAATLAVVTTNDPGRLTNISARAFVGTSAQVLIGGFYSGGSGTSGTQALLFRGDGPALNAVFGLTGNMPDPVMYLSLGSTQLASNSAWGGSAQLSTLFTTLGAYAWPSSTSLDDALNYPALASGGYTIEIAGHSYETTGNTNDTGIASVEIYDATPAGTYTATTPRLTNISARAFVASGANILIGGFYIGGSTAKTVLIRADGPALNDVFGLTPYLPNPTLTLLQGQTVLAANAGWGGNAQIAAEALALGGYAWHTNSADSALIITLPPGGYTAQISSTSGTTTGIASIEIYEIP